jgi:hypothetical protein
MKVPKIRAARRLSEQADPDPREGTSHLRKRESSEVPLATMPAANLALLEARIQAHEKRVAADLRRLGL